MNYSYMSYMVLLSIFMHQPLHTADAAAEAAAEAERATTETAAATAKTAQSKSLAEKVREEESKYEAARAATDASKVVQDASARYNDAKMAFADLEKYNKIRSRADTLPNRNDLIATLQAEKAQYESRLKNTNIDPTISTQIRARLAGVSKQLQEYQATNPILTTEKEFYDTLFQTNWNDFMEYRRKNKKPNKSDFDLFCQYSNIDKVAHPSNWVSKESIPYRTLVSNMIDTYLNLHTLGISFNDFSNINTIEEQLRQYHEGNITRLNAAMAAGGLTLDEQDALKNINIKAAQPEAGYVNQFINWIKSIFSGTPVTLDANTINNLLNTLDIGNLQLTSINALKAIFKTSFEGLSQDQRMNLINKLKANLTPENQVKLAAFLNQVILPANEKITLRGK